MILTQIDHATSMDKSRCHTDSMTFMFQTFATPQLINSYSMQSHSLHEIQKDSQNLSNKTWVGINKTMETPRACRRFA